MDLEFFGKNLNRVIEETDFANLGAKRKGKVRDVYTQSDKIILIATDRYSAFARNLALIPFKGQNLTQISNWWFKQTADIVPNHMLDTPDPNVVVVKKCRVLPVEMVMRGYITGVTNTSLWTAYDGGQRDFGDFTLPDGLHKNQKLEKPVLTPSTKSDIHDANITSKQILAEGIVEAEIWQKISDISYKLFERGQKLAAEKGLILVDTKYEFGLDERGEVMLIDEIHTPDSSRYWQAATYKERFDRGEEPQNFDKEFLRLWFKENSDPYNDEKLPAAATDMVAELARRYAAIYEQITGLKFEPDLSTNTEERLQNKLKQYFA